MNEILGQPKVRSGHYDVTKSGGRSVSSQPNKKRVFGILGSVTHQTTWNAFSAKLPSEKFWIPKIVKILILVKFWFLFQVGIMLTRYLQNYHFEFSNFPNFQNVECWCLGIFGFFSFQVPIILIRYLQNCHLEISNFKIFKILILVQIFHSMLINTHPFFCRINEILLVSFQFFSS